jgi:hypothetical protein
VKIYWLYIPLLIVVFNSKAQQLKTYLNNHEHIDFTFNNRVSERVLTPINQLSDCPIALKAQLSKYSLPNSSYYLGKKAIPKKIEFKNEKHALFEGTNKKKSRRIFTENSVRLIKINMLYRVNPKNVFSNELDIHIPVQNQKIKEDSISSQKENQQEKIETVEDYLKRYPELKDMPVDELLKNVKIKTNGTLVIKSKKAKKVDTLVMENKSAEQASLKELITNNPNLLTIKFNQLINELKISENGEISCPPIGLLKTKYQAENQALVKEKEAKITDSLHIQKPTIYQNDTNQLNKEQKNTETKGLVKETKSRKKTKKLEKEKTVKKKTKKLSINGHEYQVDQDGNKIFSDGAIERDGVLTFKGRQFNWGKDGEKIFLDEEKTQVGKLPNNPSAEKEKATNNTFKKENTTLDRGDNNINSIKKDSSKEQVKAKTDFISANVTTKGKVVSGNDAIKKARVIIQQNGQFYKEVTTDKQGMFKVLLSRSGIYTIETVKEGFISEKQTVTPGQLEADASNILLNFGMRKKEREPITEKDKKAALSREAIKKEFETIICKKTDIKTIGIVYNKEKVIEGAKIRMFSGDDLIGTTSTDEFGRFKWALPKDKKNKIYH